jgi:hypothetical protein
MPRPCVGQENDLDDGAEKNTETGRRRSANLRAREPIRSIHTLPFICGWSKVYCGPTLVAADPSGALKKRERKIADQERRSYE